MSPSATSYGNDERPWRTTPTAAPAPVTWPPFTRDRQPPTPYYPDPYSEEHHRYEEDRDRDRHGQDHIWDRFESTASPYWQPSTPHYPDPHGGDRDRFGEEVDRDRYEEGYDRDRYWEDRDNTVDRRDPYQPGTMLNCLVTSALKTRQSLVTTDKALKPMIPQ